MIKGSMLISNDGRVFETKQKNMDYSFLIENEHLGNNLMLLGYGGSLSYGTNLPTSDIDIRGLALRSREDILLGKDWGQVERDEPDVCIYSFDKMVSLLTQSNPNVIEILGLRDKDYLYKSELGQLLLDNKRIFLSKNCIGSFGGYANSQLYRLRQKTKDALSPFEFNEHIVRTINGMYDHLMSAYDMPDARKQIDVKVTEEGIKVDINNIYDMPIEKFRNFCEEINEVIKSYNKESKRNKKAIEHEKVDKHAMHLLRVYMEGIDILEKQEIITYREDEHDLLMDIRLGKYSDPETQMMNKEFWDLLADYEWKFREAIKKSTLPDKPDLKAINEFKLKVNSLIVEKSEDLDKEYEGDFER